jgi:hypothetical protein
MHRGWMNPVAAPVGATLAPGGRPGPSHKPAKTASSMTAASPARHDRRCRARARSVRATTLKLCAIMSRSSRRCARVSP